MNRDAYLRILRAQLSGRIPAGDLEDILRYYEEYFEDAGEDREGAVMAELGSPEHLAKQILGERAAEGMANPGTPGGEQRRRTPDYGAHPRHPGSGKLPGWAFVLICIGVALITSPIWLGIFGGLGGGGVGCIIAGLTLAVYGVTMPTVAAGLYTAGGGLVAVAIGALLLLGGIVLVWLLIKGVRYLWSTSVEGGDRHDHEEVQ